MRKNPKEIELKLTVTPAHIAALKAHKAFSELLEHPVASENLTSVYFDTDRFDLRHHGVTLRVRRKGGQFVQTIKSSSTASPLERSEWEQPLQTGQPDLNVIADTALEPILTPEVRAALKPVFETRIRRTYYHLADTGWRIEIALDEGEIVAGNRSLPICEIELELKHGYRAALFELARMIVEVVPAQLSLSAKSERAYELFEDKAQEAVYAASIDLAPGTTTAQAFQAISRNALHQLIANVPLMNSRNPEGLHQMRIAVRRLRTAISVFGDVVRDGQVKTIRSEMKWLNGELSPARDHDTLAEEVMNPLREQHPEDRGLKSLSFTLARRRVGSYRRAHDAVHSQRFSKLLIETFAWIEIGEWITTTDELTRMRRDWPIETFAADQLSRRRKQVKKKGRDLQKLDPAHRHKLRIQVKKTRYAAEFFANLFHDRKVAGRRTKMLSALKRLQSSLGGLNDVMTRKSLCAELLAQQPRALNGAAGRDRAFAAGLVTGSQEARRDELLADASKAHAQFEDTKPFWK